MLSALIPLSVVIAGSSIILGFVALSRSRTSSGDTLAGQLMKIDLESGRILGALESPGHMLSLANSGDIYVASLTGNVLKWQPAEKWWPAPAPM